MDANNILQYLVIQLDDTRTSYCHNNNITKRQLISLENLNKGILLAIKDNLVIQFLYPDYTIPKEYKVVMNTIRHSIIVSSTCEDEEIRQNADVIILNSTEHISHFDFEFNKVYVLRIGKADFLNNTSIIKDILTKDCRLNITITDVENFKDDDIEMYKKILETFNEVITHEYTKEHFVQFNLLTDRIMLDRMNNCNAGWENVTLAPDGRFYVCPVFYLAGDDDNYGIGKTKFSIGDLDTGLNIKNPQLYMMAYAPLCRKLLAEIRKNGNFYLGHEICDINNLDPFEIIEGN